MKRRNYNDFNDTFIYGSDRLFDINKLNTIRQLSESGYEPDTGTMDAVDYLAETMLGISEKKDIDNIFHDNGSKTNIDDFSKPVTFKADSWEEIDGKKTEIEIIYFGKTKESTKYNKRITF